MKIYKPPFNIRKINLDNSIFLAGSIENGKAIDWQKEIEKELTNIEGIILNPRRDSWDSSWTQSKDNSNFKGQVEWELYGLENATIIILYLQPGTKSPISLLEFGLHLKSGKLLVCCPDGYIKKGNVDVTCGFYKIPIIEHFNSLIKTIKEIVT